MRFGGHNHPPECVVEHLGPAFGVVLGFAAENRLAGQEHQGQRNQRVDPERR